MPLQYISLAYQQGAKDTCVLSSFASALHYKGEMSYAKIVSEKVQVRGATLLKDLADVVNKHFRGYQFVKVPSHWDILQNNPVQNITLVQLQGRDGGTGYAVSVLGDLIFDSSWRYALVRCSSRLDWCCGTGGFLKVYKAFVLTKLQCPAPFVKRRVKLSPKRGAIRKTKHISFERLK